MENTNSYQDSLLPHKAENVQSEITQATSEVAANPQPANDATVNESSSTYGANTDAQSGIVLSPRGMKNLRRAASWATFLSILYFVGLFFFFIFGIFLIIKGAMSPNDYECGYNIGVGVTYIACTAFGVIAAFAQFSFAQKAKRACDKADSMKLEESMDRLSFLYKYMGILSIVYIVFVVLAVIFAVISAVIAGG